MGLATSEAGNTRVADVGNLDLILVMFAKNLLVVACVIDYGSYGGMDFFGPPLGDNAGRKPACFPAEFSEFERIN
jgi:hypothetical protein